VLFTHFLSPFDTSKLELLVCLFVYSAARAACPGSQFLSRCQG
jgi:hypothetical protein